MPHPVRGPFDVWAPLPERVRLVTRRSDTTDDALSEFADDVAELLGGAATSTSPTSTSYEVLEMERADDGWWSPTVPIPDGDEVDYGYLVGAASDPGDPVDALPDPRSRRQPHGVHGLSRTFDPDTHAWGDDDWTGRQLAGAVIYELHVGTFTPEGTLDAAIEKLSHLVAIGVDFVEVMPVNAVNGTWNWGYDGVLWSAIHEPYGGPAAYQRFVDACHGAGLGVVQDVVHNHLGPSGNYLPRFGPYLKSGANTWGDLINLDADSSAEVRRLILDNVRMWFTDFHVDALRLDAVHALDDSSDVHLLQEMAIETAALSAYLGRPLTLIAESDLNDPRLVTPREGGGYGLDAQWSDDFHHAVHVALSGETTGYYADFAPLSALAKVCNEGFFHAGTYSSFRGRDHGVPIDREHMPTWRLVVSNQNHDQVGNRARGDRLTEHLDEHQLGCAALLTLAGPFTPMLFMGEEYAASTPFAFFTSHPEPDLGKATAEGRIKEFEKMGWDPDEVLDPQDPATFEASKLDWTEAETGRGARVLDRYRQLGALRRSVPALTDPHFDNLEANADEESGLFLLHRCSTVPGPDALIAVNTGGAGVRVPLAEHPELAFTTGDGVRIAGGQLDLPAHAGALVLTPRPAR